MWACFAAIRKYFVRIPSHRTVATETCAGRQVRTVENATLKSCRHPYDKHAFDFLNAVCDAQPFQQSYGDITLVAQYMDKEVKNRGLRVRVVLSKSGCEGFCTDCLNLRYSHRHYCEVVGISQKDDENCHALFSGRPCAIKKEYARQALTCLLTIQMLLCVKDGVCNDNKKFNPTLFLEHSLSELHIEETNLLLPPPRLFVGLGNASTAHAFRHSRLYEVDTQDPVLTCEDSNLHLWEVWQQVCAEYKHSSLAPEYATKAFQTRGTCVHTDNTAA